LDMRREVSKAIVRLLKVTRDGVYIDAMEIAELIGNNSRNFVRSIAKVLSELEDKGLLTKIYGRTPSDSVYFVSKSMMERFKRMLRG